MSIFSNTNPTPTHIPAAVSPLEGLPEGYGDESSLWFVPSHLRDRYAQINDGDIQPGGDSYPHVIESGAQRIARHALIADPGTFSKKDAAERARILRARVDAVKKSEPLRAISAELHAYKVAAAKLAYENDERNREAVELARVAGTCPVCGEYDSKANGQLRPRHVFGDSGWGAVMLVSCGSCFLVALELARATATTPHRLHAVGEALASAEAAS